MASTYRSSHQPKQALCLHPALHQQNMQLPIFHCLCTAQLCSTAKLPGATTQLPGCIYLLGGAQHVPQGFQTHTYALHLSLVTLHRHPIHAPPQTLQLRRGPYNPQPQLQGLCSSLSKPKPHCTHYLHMTDLCAGWAMDCSLQPTGQHWWLLSPVHQNRNQTSQKHKSTPKKP